VLRARRRAWHKGYGLVLANPIAPADEMDRALHDRVLAAALTAAETAGVYGKDVTPFLLEFREEELVVSRPLGAIDTNFGDSHKMSVAFVEGRVFEEEQDGSARSRIAGSAREAPCAWPCGRSIRSSLRGSKPRAPVPAGRLAASPARAHDLLQFRRDRRLPTASGNKVHQLQTRGNKDG